MTSTAEIGAFITLWCVHNGEEEARMRVRRNGDEEAQTGSNSHATRQAVGRADSKEIPTMKFDKSDVDAREQDRQPRSDISQPAERALSKQMTVLPDGGRYWRVVEYDTVYTVNAHEGVCTCHSAAKKCRHERRIEFATGMETVPSSWWGGVPARLASALDTEPVYVRTGDNINWEGPYNRRDAQGKPTETAYVVCPSCGIEVEPSVRQHAIHYPECDHVEDGDAVRWEPPTPGEDGDMTDVWNSMPPENSVPKRNVERLPRLKQRADEMRAARDNDHPLPRVAAISE